MPDRKATADDEQQELWAPKRRKAAEAKDARATQLSPFLWRWKARWGFDYTQYGRLARALKQLDAAGHPKEQQLLHYDHFLASHTDPRYATPEQFAGHFPHWAAVHRPGPRDDREPLPGESDADYFKRMGLP